MFRVEKIVYGDESVVICTKESNYRFSIKSGTPMERHGLCYYIKGPFREQFIDRDLFERVTGYDIGGIWPWCKTKDDLFKYLNALCGNVEQLKYLLLP